MTRQGSWPRMPKFKPHWDVPPDMLAHETQPERREERVILLIDGDNANSRILEATEGIIDWGMFRRYVHLACNSYQEGPEEHQTLTPVGPVTQAHLFRTVYRSEQLTNAQLRDILVRIDQNLRDQLITAHLYDRYKFEPGYSDREITDYAWTQRDEFNTFIFVSNDADFWPFMEKLRGYDGGRRVIHVGIRGSGMSPLARLNRMPYVDLNTMMNHFTALVAPRPQRVLDHLDRVKKRSTTVSEPADNQ